MIENRVSTTVERPNGRRLVSVHGDITREQVDAIVNAANSRLLHGGGVAGAIVRRGGRPIQEESLAVAPVATGSAKATGAGRLPCKMVIHAVGPVWGGGNAGEEGLLASAVEAALTIAHNSRLTTISFPAISAGIFGYPPRLAAAVIVAAADRFLAAHPDSSLAQIRFCNVDPQMVALFDESLALLTG
ncbi:MAG: macro domain-containing protein [Deltaproteobacteria bacterium]|nr:macro domain-containing protein [Deltaproteobacteria bacterium]